QSVPHDALLIAAGGRPKPPPWPGSDEVSQVLGFQTIDDTDAIIAKADAAERVLVMGGSFIGYELAEGVSFRKTAKVTWIMRGPWFLRYVLDEEGGRLGRELGEAQGVDVLTAAGDVAVFYDLMVERHNQMGTWDNAEAHGKVAARNMAGADEDFFDVPTYTTTMFGSTLAVAGVTPDVQPDLESVRTYSFEEKYYRKLFFKAGRLVGA